MKRPGFDTEHLADWPVRKEKAHTPHGHGDCKLCRGRCCTYIAVRIPTPTTPDDVDEIRWFLAHDRIDVFIEQGVWYIQFYTPCKFLNADGLCGIYPERFEVCRRHSVTECEMTDGLPDTVAFSTTAQFDAWWKAELEKQERLKKAPKRWVRKNGRIIYRRAKP